MIGPMGGGTMSNLFGMLWCPCLCAFVLCEIGLSPKTPYATSPAGPRSLPAGVTTRAPSATRRTVPPAYDLQPRVYSSCPPYRQDPYIHVHLLEGLVEACGSKVGHPQTAAV